MTDLKPPVYDARLENLDASPVNPQRIGRFVKVVRVPRPRMNAGTWWQLTDGHGAFWDVRPDRLRPVPEGEQPDDEVARLRSVLAGRERELKAALTQVHELRTAADTVQAREPDEVAVSTVREWGVYDLVSERALNHPYVVEQADDAGDARVMAGSWATGRVCWRDVTYGRWTSGRPPELAEPSGDTVQPPADLVEAARAWARWIDEGHGSAINHVTAPIYDAVAKLDYEQPADTVQASPAEIAGWDGPA